MSDYNSPPNQPLYLSPHQQDLLLAALSSNNQPPKNSPAPKQEPDSTPRQGPSASFSISPNALDHNPESAYESPFLDFNPDPELDFPGSDSLIGDLPGSFLPDDYEPGDKRKGIDGKSEDDQEESGKKRRESDEKVARKPGRKPLTSEPTTKRKAQNRAAQRAFRERKEQHLKELETKIDDLQKSSDSANQENGLLRAQIDRMQVELREYRTRISWLTHGNGASAMSAIPGSYSKGSGLNNNDFLFDFPKFGDLPGAHIFGNSQSKKNPNASTKDTSQIPGVLSREALSSQSASRQSASKNGSMHSHSTSSPASHATRNSSSDGKAGNRNDAAAPARANGKPSTNDTSNSDSPSSSSDSHQSQLLSSNDTSPESSPNFFPGKQKTGHENCGHIDGEKSFCDQLGLACGSINNPIPAVRHDSASASNTPNQANPAGNEDPDFGLDLLSQQNGGQFDPVLFGDWREPQDAILSQDFGSYFNDAFPLPELGSPSHNFADLPSQPTPAPKKDAVPGGNNKLDEEVVPGEDKSQMLTCTKIWDRLQSMDRFRNGEIDVDNLCSELRTKARCSEGGVVVNQDDVDNIMCNK